MKYYDFPKAVALITEHKPDQAEMGIAEDWFWTGQEIYVAGIYMRCMRSPPIVAGISGSFWGTPILRLTKDGSSIDHPCWTETEPA